MPLLSAIRDVAFVQFVSGQVEGELTLQQDAGETPIKTGGFAFLPGERGSAVVVYLEDPLHILSFLGWESEVASCEIGSRRYFDYFVLHEVLDAFDG